MKVDFAARVDIGTKETNDDRVLIGGNILDMSAYSGTSDLPIVAAVCDGCGGYMGGGIAAQTVLEFLSFEQAGDLSDLNYLSEVLANCEREVEEKKAEMPQFSKMCTTIAGCMFSEDRTILFHSGDSRIYRFDRWGATRMTRDHSVVQDLIDMGEITSEEALSHPRRNVITRCIGIGAERPEIYVSMSPIGPEEKFLLFSDGLWESVSDSEIDEILSRDISLQNMVDALIEKALQQGADDNISVCICARQS